MWFGTPERPERILARAAGAPTPPRDGLPSNDVNTLFEDRAGIVWVGHGQTGMAVVQGGRVAHGRGPRRRPARVDPRLGRRTAGARCGSHATDAILRVNREPLLPATPAAERRARVRHRRRPARAWTRSSGSASVVADARAASGSRSRRGLSMADPDARRRPRDAGDDARRVNCRPTAQRSICAVRFAMSGRPPPDRVRLRRPEPVGAGARAVPLSPRRLRSRLERAGHRAAGRLHQPRRPARIASASSRRTATDCGTGPRRRSRSRSSRRSGRRAWFQCGRRRASALGRGGAVPAAHAPGVARSSTSGSRSAWPSGPASPRSCTTRCCRASSARRCSCTSRSIGCRRIAGAAVARPRARADAPRDRGGPQRRPRPALGRHGAARSRAGVLPASSRSWRSDSGGVSRHRGRPAARSSSR